MKALMEYYEDLTKRILEMSDYEAEHGVVRYKDFQKLTELASEASTAKVTHYAAMAIESGEDKREEERLNRLAKETSNIVRFPKCTG